MIFFDPMGLLHTKLGNPRKTHRMGKPKYFLQGIKAAGGVDLYPLCRKCFRPPRRVDQERCNTEMCADLEELEEEFGEASGEPTMTRASFMVCGFGGLFLGLLLYGWYGRGHGISVRLRPFRRSSPSAGGYWVCPGAHVRLRPVRLDAVPGKEERPATAGCGGGRTTTRMALRVLAFVVFKGGW
jgi:hypothetical protein